MHKAFINDIPLIFGDVYKIVSDDEKSFQMLSDSEFSLTQVIEKLNEKGVQGIVYLCASPDRAWTDFTGRYILSEAAGGVVKNSLGEVLIIYRKKRWDLPKGKLDYRESPENAAVREVQEECGIEKVELGRFLLKTFHVYTEKNKFILKKTHWYEMTADDNQKLIPQAEEDIEEVRWMDKEKILNKVFSKTYNSIKDVLKFYFESRN